MLRYATLYFTEGSGRLRGIARSPHDWQPDWTGACGLRALRQSANRSANNNNQTKTTAPPSTAL
eukprot:3732080-Heterocapsa_arctica.AAC.1